MTEEWAKLWYQCLAESRKYTAYQAARKGEGSERVPDLERLYPKLPELFEDFGELWPWLTVSPEDWSEWFSSHKHLFMHSARVVDDLSDYQSQQGFLLLEVPLRASAKETAALVRGYLEHSYADGKVAQAPPPKYKLHTKDGRTAAGYEQVRKACAAGYLEFGFSFNHETFSQQEGEWEDATHRVLVTQFARYELDTMGWSLDPKARKELEEHGTLSEDRFESFKSMLNRSRREFRLLAANALQGRFPDLSAV